MAPRNELSPGEQLTHHLLSASVGYFSGTLTAFVSDTPQLNYDANIFSVNSLEQLPTILTSLGLVGLLGAEKAVDPHDPGFVENSITAIRTLCLTLAPSIAINAPTFWSLWLESHTFAEGAVPIAALTTVVIALISSLYSISILHHTREIPTTQVVPNESNPEDSEKYKAWLEEDRKNKEYMREQVAARLRVTPPTSPEDQIESMLKNR